MKNKAIVGIDVSKKILDCYILAHRYYFQINNDSLGFARLLEVCHEKLGIPLNDIQFYFEETGRYSRQLSIFLEVEGISFTKLNALDVKRSMGLRRGKSDRKDAQSIALYAQRKHSELQPTCLPGPVIDQLKGLLSLREKYIKHRTAYKNGMKDLHDGYSFGEFDFIRAQHQEMVKTYNEMVHAVESKILMIIKSEQAFSRNYELLVSVKGIGKILSFYFIVLTENFTRFDNPRKFACYAGIAPFEYSSGTSVAGRTKVHPFANKQIKTLLNIASMAVIQQKGEYQQYFNRRTEIGKNKMSTLNIIRNKIVSRAFAVIKRQTPFVDLDKFAA